MFPGFISNVYFSLSVVKQLVSEENTHLILVRIGSTPYSKGIVKETWLQLGYTEGNIYQHLWNPSLLIGKYFQHSLIINSHVFYSLFARWEATSQQEKK